MHKPQYGTKTCQKGPKVGSEYWPTFKTSHCVCTAGAPRAWHSLGSLETIFSSIHHMHPSLFFWGGGPLLPRVLVHTSFAGATSAHVGCSAVLTVSVGAGVLRMGGGGGGVEAPPPPMPPPRPSGPRAHAPGRPITDPQMTQGTTSTPVQALQQATGGHIRTGRAVHLGAIATRRVHDNQDFAGQEVL